MGLPSISYFDMATAATGWLAISVVSIFGVIASLIAVIAGLRVFSRFMYFR
ncbi:hypothetical protein Despr_0408 [Desulfobulbus propionicus DSM 2032]|jgi:hypothetical protein|uniref:Uncharacterized protein n=1 Tax=Desulfobulbus propionicus (strain ATCC 33891 / DSM 2032 / VKM B-1956 / 1pr3) TaxID=577650 RepID=A0A7U3YJL2_DESPD|nr:hypothetical protein Despr_0408 [Desulfobulbus propionicus DSM 2032]